MKKILTALCLMCFMAFTLVFTGCSPKGLTDNPPTDANVTSNGGMTVVKGDYLYYVNGYLDETTLGKHDNKFGEVSHTGIYRTKLVDGNIQKDEEGFVVNTELVVPKVVGFDNGGFYIIDDYIYYTTPYMNLDRDGNLQSDRVEFRRININGTEDDLIYVTSEAQDNLNWSLYKVNGTVYLATYVGNKIIIVNTSNDAIVSTIENVTSYAFLKETEYKTGKELNSEAHKYIYYTRDINDTDNANGNQKGNVICKVNIETGEITKIEMSRDFTYTIKDITTDNIYYLKKNAIYSGYNLMYTKGINLGWSISSETQLGFTEYNSYYVCDFGTNLVIASNSNGTYLLENGYQTAKKVSTTEKTILKVFGGYAYYASSNVLNRFAVRGEVVDNEIESEVVTAENKTHIITNGNYIDFDNQRVYVYAEYTSADSTKNMYLNYISSSNEGEVEQRFVGKFNDSHIPALPEQPEPEHEDETVEKIPHID